MRVQLPKTLQGVYLDDETVSGNHACDYPPYVLDKLISGKFAKSGSPALKFVRKWKWTAKDQNSVAYQIGVKHVKPEKAAAAWVKAHPKQVKSGSPDCDVRRGG